MDDRQQAQLSRAMARLADGDRQAFDQVYVLCWPLVRALTSRLLSGHESAEDVSQQTLLKIFEQAHTYDPSRPALPWILGTAAYEVKTHKKKIYRRREDPAPPDRACDRPSPEQALAQAELVQAVRAVLSQLSEQDLHTILAAMGQRERPAGVASATFRKRLQRSMGRMRLAWRKQHD